MRGLSIFCLFVSIKRTRERLEVASPDAFATEATHPWKTPHLSPQLSPLPDLFHLLSISQTPSGRKAYVFYLGAITLLLSMCSQGLDVFL